MNEELKRVYGELLRAVTAEDVFGQLSAENIEGRINEVKTAYWRLAKIVFPDYHRNDPEDFEMANEASQILNKFRDEAELKIKNGGYGYFSGHGRSSDVEDVEFVIKRPGREYYVVKPAIAEGNLSMVYNGYCSGGKSDENSIIVKILKDPVDVDLMQNEAKIIRILQAEPSNQSKHLPILLDQFRTTDRRMGLIFRRFDGHDFYSVRENEQYKDGVPEKHAVWMLNRLLSVLGYVHKKGVIHGNIEPSHLMIRPRDHNLCLIDWSYGAVNPFATGDGFKIFNEDFSAPEVKEKKSPLPASDLYSAGKGMIYILGGDIKTNSLPDSVNEELQRFIQFFVRESPLQRAQDAWEMHGRLIELIGHFWGPKQFLEFKM